VIRLERLAIPSLFHRETRDVREELRHETVVRRIKMHDHHEYEPGSLRHRAEERLEGLEAARRSSDADDR
jgi:hypothetical protein